MIRFWILAVKLQSTNDLCSCSGLPTNWLMKNKYISLRLNVVDDPWSKPTASLPRNVNLQIRDKKVCSQLHRSVLTVFTDS